MSDKSALAILLLAFGGPGSLEAVESFLKSVIKGRPVTEELIGRATEKYRLIGGKSPLVDITLRQAKALEAELRKGTVPIRLDKGQSPLVYAAMRHSRPFINDTLRRMAGDGVSKVLALISAPFNSAASTGGYKKAVEEALPQLPDGLEVSFIPSWHNHPRYIQALADMIKEGLAGFAEESQKVYVLFSAHSLPEKAAQNDPYVEQLKETIGSVVNVTGMSNYSLAYQSRGGGEFEWLGPDVAEVLEEIATKGFKDLLLAPLSFVADNIETLYDIDMVYKKKASELGLNFRRLASFNDSPEFIKALAGIISSYTAGPSPDQSNGDCHQTNL